jgi:hypothetical protein
MKQAIRCTIGVTTMLLLLGLMPVISEAGSTKPKKPLTETGQAIGSTSSSAVLAPDAISSYCQDRLGNIDATLNQKMGQQNKAAKGQGAGNCQAKSTVLTAPAASTTQGSDLQMIQIQNSTTQRQNAVTETTQMLQNTQCKPCLNNIGN